jgi:hypothetical protein
VVNELNIELTDDTLNQLAIEDSLTSEKRNLSLNAISETANGDYEDQGFSAKQNHANSGQF